MKRTILFLFSAIVILLSACSGSETYRGKWKATDQNGNHIDIVFGENDFSLTEKGETKNFEYTQTAVNITNSVETYGINIEGGKSLQIHFPIADDESRGEILDANGSLQYVISRNEYIEY